MANDRGLVRKQRQAAQRETKQKKNLRKSGKGERAKKQPAKISFMYFIRALIVDRFGSVFVVCFVSNSRRIIYLSAS
jgi:hypothetical protein